MKSKRLSQQREREQAIRNYDDMMATPSRIHETQRKKEKKKKFTFEKK